MNISVVSVDKIYDYEASINAHLSSIFGKNTKLILNHEFACAIVIENNNQIIATGIAYHRLMQQGIHNFRAGIIGGIAVSSNMRGRGLAKTVIQELDQYLISIEVIHTFLFAYNFDIYKSSGYEELTLPIHYLDLKQSIWNLFVYRGGMIKTYNHSNSLDDQFIDFNGCVY
ncbi:GNAT family N-acetyltransferase [Photobacterium damselae]|uniref:GNAT family N-acetyltransferase n=1 Tax=Photobacterium damselae TaxID=38293 RepID=A0ACD3T258_PHODM|nr:GNAT family N-acetyltransferase [Photobacterium damselae]RDL34933.1 hypothetical protein BC461_03435 [Photobacterium damselae]TMX53775.1 GNAT family N-acetyltransferase [Photobacterium damselae]TMX64026.1 GNAT family N-acetyltransferase [Photobacterium damselae]TMX77136.1 GNAT family N-acetyltransferase [Photobacterium damselae]